MALESAREAMDKAIGHMETELTKIRAGKAHPAMLDSVMVEYYGSMTPLTQVTGVRTPLFPSKWGAFFPGGSARRPHPAKEYSPK